jgi:glycosyltransferase involved in cell wall biosynthesis
MAFLSTAKFTADHALPIRRLRPAVRPAAGGVAHVVNSDRWGGMEARTLETAEWQAAQGLPTVIVTTPGGALFEAARRRRLDVRAFDFAARDKLAGARRMRAIFKDHGVRVADFHTNRSYALAVRDLATLVRTQHVLRRFGSRGAGLNREFPFDRFILTSEAGSQAVIAAGYARDARVDVVGEWAPERFFAAHPTPAERALRRARLNIPADAPVIGAAGMLRADNAFDELIRATARLHARGLPAHCLVIGGPMRPQARPCAEEQALRALAQALGLADYVHVLGHRDDVPELLDVMDVAAVVSRHTAQTRVAPEAAARGRPVVAFDVGALHETLPHGRSGLLTPPGDAEAFAGALERLLRDPEERLRLGQEALRLAHARFRQRGKMEETLAVYRTAMAARWVRPRPAPAPFATAAALSLEAA